MDSYKDWLVRLLPKQWVLYLKKYWDTTSFQYLSDFLLHQYYYESIAPLQKNIFAFLQYVSPVEHSLYSASENAMHTLTSPKVVILLDEPFYNTQEKLLLPFSNLSMEHLSLELSNDLQKDSVTLTLEHIEHWQRQGVVLLHSVRTINTWKKHSHVKKGWEEFTDGVLECINRYCTGVVFLLWGTRMKRKAVYINGSKHLILLADSPSSKQTYTNGFCGCKHFSKVNQYLLTQSKTPIQWL